jgi:phosphatidate cytidylyltransferase
LVVSVLKVIISYFLVGGAGVVIISRKLGATEKRLLWKKYIVYLFIVLMSFFLIVCTALFPAFCFLLFLIGFKEMMLAPKVRTSMVEHAVSLTCYTLLGVGFLLFAGTSTTRQMLLMFILVVVFDGFSQISGQLFGKHQLMPGISPLKTVEGLIGGLVFCVLTNLLICPEHTYRESVTIALFVGVSAFSGDVLASWFKRRRGIKDFGNIVPAHGGVLDRFDSLISASALSYLFLLLTPDFI